MRKTKALTNSEFLARVREYLPMDAVIRATDHEGNPVLTTFDESIADNEFYILDGEAVTAFCCAIEEFALEEANGSFLAAIQDFKFFDAISERYWQLAATLDDVQVIGSGRQPRRNSQIKFCNCGNSELNKFWLVLYEGRTNRVMFLCEQSNDARKFDDKQFLGFYTFNERVINQAKQDIADLLGGKCPQLRQFGQLHAIDRAAKRVQVEFAREQRTLAVAIKKLKDASRSYRKENFLRELNRSLQRLNELKTHLPELIVGRRND